MEMELIHIIALLATGVGVGFASGLLGIGGCFIMIPVQYWVYLSMGVEPGIAIKLAFGTNLFVVVPTAISGSLGHHRKGAVWWKAAFVLGVCGLVGAIAGATIATHIPGNILVVVFGAVILLGGVRMLTARPPKVEEEPKDSVLLWVLWGLPLGIVTGFIGIGGGVLMVPVMTLFLKFRIHRAVGTSTAMMILTSIGGLIGYIVNGWNVAGIPSPNLGYVHIWSWLALAVTSVGMAQVGAKAAHLLPARQLKLIFIIVMLYMGLKMIGVFHWLHLPI
ncbi:MAG: sulfite exporter TauE/SafE family protein [Deltaproteobacteria bacterium]|nr:sulfite exporter TauE/SafE family protein [Deltaproteobacteria bacterium]